MKKNYALLLLGMAALSSNAQQINGDFNAEWEKCIPWDSKNNTVEKGTQPQGWHMANVVLAGTVGEKVTRAEGDYAVKLNNVSMVGQKVPGYITLGTPWATAETQGTNVRNADGGAFGGKEFTFHPDAISFDYQRDNSKDDTEPATVVAYLWKGTWTQKDVPGNTAVGLFSYANATKVDMTDRDRNVLGMTDYATGGDVSKSDDAMLVASLQHSITESTNGEWKTATIPFVYTNEALGVGDADAELANVEKANIIFSATNYFGDRTKIVEGNSLTIDNVKFIYYHELEGLTTTDADGNPIDFDKEFKSDVYNYSVNSAFDEDFTEWEYTLKGIGATVEEAYDSETALLTLTVKAEDYDAETNPDAKTVYTIQYLKPAPTLTSLVVSGHEFIKAGDTNTSFKATGCHGDDVSFKAASKTATIDYIWENDPSSAGQDGNVQKGTDKLIITVSDDGCNDNTYTVTFENNSKAGVYQIPNSDFENWTTYVNGMGENADKLAESWNSFESAAGLFASFASMSPVPEKIEGVSGNAVRLTSKDLWIAYANGNLTTGTINMGNTNPTDASNFNFTDVTNVDGNLPFAGTPDAFEVYARFTPGTAKALTEEEIAAGVQQPALNGRVQLILHGNTDYHDPELADQADYKVASASVVIPETAEWTKFEGKFEYPSTELPAEMYMLASATTNPVPGASKDDKLDLDNLKLIYYSTLKSLAIKGTPVEGFSPERTEYTVNMSINDAEDNVTYEKSGFGGSIDEDFDETTNKLTITVYGDDYSVNSANKTVYTITFNDPASGIDSISATDAAYHKVYTLGGVRVNGKPAAGIYIVDGKKMAVK